MTLPSFSRTAVSSSWEFVMNLRSPQIAGTRRCGYGMLAIIAAGSPAPIVADALSSSSVFATQVRWFRANQIL